MTSIARPSLITWLPYKELVPVAFEDFEELKEKLNTMFGGGPIILTRSDLAVLKAWREVGFEPMGINELIEAIMIHDQIEVNIYESQFYTPPVHDEAGE